MKTRIKNILNQLLHSPQEFPVEAAMGFIFFCISAWHTSHAEWNTTIGEMASGVNADILWLFVPLLVLTFWLHKVSRWAYIASGLLFLPLMALDLKPFLWTYGFAFTYVLAAILLLVGKRNMDNRSFAAHALHVVTQMLFGVVISGLLTLAAMAIVASFLYIFGIDMPQHLYEYIWEFIWFFIAPQICCTLISQDEDVVSGPAKVLRLILNFILSPAQRTLLRLVLPPIHLDCYSSAHHVLDRFHLPHTPLQFHREPFLPDGGWRVDDPLHPHVALAPHP